MLPENIFIICRLPESQFFSHYFQRPIWFQVDSAICNRALILIFHDDGALDSDVNFYQDNNNK